MRSRFVPGGTGLIGLLLLLGACNSQCSSSHPSLTCSGDSAAHHAYVVVEHESGASITRCIGFSGDSIDGETAMQLSGLEYRTQSNSSGKAMCQVDGEPAKYDQCFPQNQPYWALFVESNGHWSSTPAGYTHVTLHNGDALGWHYVKADDPAPAPPPLPATT